MRNNDENDPKVFQTFSGYRGETPEVNKIQYSDSYKYNQAIDPVGGNYAKTNKKQTEGKSDAPKINKKGKKK